MMIKNLKKNINRLTKDNTLFSVLSGLLAFQFLEPYTAFAALPWETPLTSLQTSLTGPVARAVCAIVVCVSGLMIALGEGGQFGRLCARLIFGLALTVGFMQIINMFA